MNYWELTPADIGAMSAAELYGLRDRALAEGEHEVAEYLHSAAEHARHEEHEERISNA